MGERGVQLYLYTFTGLPKSGYRSCGSTDHLSDACPLSHPRSRGALSQSDLCFNFNKGRPCSRLPCPYKHRCNQPGCSAAHSGEDRAKLTRHREDRPKSSSSSNNSSRAHSYIFPPLSSHPIDIAKLASYLQGHPDPLAVKHLISGFSQGFKIGYSGPRAPKEYSNLPCAKSNPLVIDKNLLKEVTLGHTAGPFLAPPFPNLQVYPIRAIPKKHSSEWRTIFHLSYSKHRPNSINAHISPESYSPQHIKVDHAISILQELGQGCFMSKLDIKTISAHRSSSKCKN